MRWPSYPLSTSTGPSVWASRDDLIEYETALAHAAALEDALQVRLVRGGGACVGWVGGWVGGWG